MSSSEEDQKRNTLLVDFATKLKASIPPIDFTKLAMTVPSNKNLLLEAQQETIKEQRETKDILVALLELTIATQKDTKETATLSKWAFWIAIIATIATVLQALAALKQISII